MKFETIKRNKKLIIIEGLVVLLAVTIFVTMAYLSTGDKQSLANTFSSGCLNITIDSESTAIDLDNTYPVADTEGLTNEPYTFTIKNNCSKLTNYMINLESLNETTNTLSSNYIKVSLSSDTNDNLISILSSNDVTKNYLTGSYISYNIYNGIIEGNKSKTFYLREWMDYDTTKEEGTNKTFTNKINVIADPDINVIAKPEIKFSKDELTLTGELTSGTNIKYCKTTDNICTPEIEGTISDNKTTIELENSKKSQMVCVSIDDNKTICSNPYIVLSSSIEILAMNIEQSDGTYKGVSEIPSSGYTLNKEESYCEVNGIKDTSITMEYENGKVNVNNIGKNGTKCYLYFDIKTPTNVQELIESKTIATRDDFSTVLTTDTTGTIYQAEDNDGTSYYFAGAPTDNWVKLGNMYWRIVRINGDGTIRLIYNGTSTTTTGTGTLAKTGIAYNTSYNNNMYVGYMYTSGSVHGYGTASNIKTQLDSWYDSNLASYASYIDTNAGFCNDRVPYTDTAGSTSGGGSGTTITYYAGYIRLITNKAPSFKCSDSNDLFTPSGSIKGNKKLSKPIGLITADEVAYAGGVYGPNNTSYYLYNNQYYWTMSPPYFNGSIAYVFFVGSDGWLGYYRVDYTRGVRPVINLKADTVFQEGGLGTAEKPYIVN